jgi:hypothetical protein
MRGTGTAIIIGIENTPQDIPGIAVVIGRGCGSRSRVRIIVIGTHGTFWVAVTAIGQQIIVIRIQVENPGMVVNNIVFRAYRCIITVTIRVVIIVPISVRAPGITPVMI